MIDSSNLFLLNLELTNACNYSCIHCYGSFSPTLNPTRIALRKIKEFIPSMIDLGLRRVHLSGGEPLLLGNELFEIISFLKYSGLEVFLLTNGSLLNKSTLKELENSQINGLQISGFGTKEHHNIIRNDDNAYDEFVSKIDMLSNSELYTILMITLFKKNLGDIGHVVDLVEKYNINAVAFERMIPIGSASNMSAVFNLSPIEYSDAIKEINEISHNRRCSFAISFSDPLKVLKNKELQNISLNNQDTICGGCTIGSVISISPSGDINPCAKLRLPLGNVNFDNFLNTWTNNKILKRFRFRIDYNYNCNKCNYLNICSGCRANAFALTNDVFEKDPLCWKE